MRHALSRLLLAATLAPALAQAQSITPTQVEIRLYEQAGAQVLGQSQRVYTNHFNTFRTRYIGVEVNLDYPAAAAAFQLSISCQMTRPDGSAIAGIWRIGARIDAGSTHATGANTMFGAGKDGWQTGIFKVSCSGSRPLGETQFQMSPGPSLMADGELRLKEVKFFPTGPKIQPAAERHYQDRFSGEEVTRIGIELTFINPGWTKSGAVPIDCYYLPTTSYVLGVMHMTYDLEPGVSTGTAAIGLGWDQPGRWEKRDYLAVCQIHGRPIAVERFTVW